MCMCTNVCERECVCLKRVWERGWEVRGVEKMEKMNQRLLSAY